MLDMIFSFADHTAVITTDKSYPVVEAKINIHFKEMYQWLAVNKLSLNINKTVFEPTIVVRLTILKWVGNNTLHKN